MKFSLPWSIIRAGTFLGHSATVQRYLLNEYLFMRHLIRSRTQEACLLSAASCPMIPIRPLTSGSDEARDPQEGAQGTAEAEEQQATTSENTDDGLASAVDGIQGILDRFRGMGIGFTVTGEGKAVAFHLTGSPREVVIIEGPEAWQYHDNPLFSDCVLEIEGLPRMHACAGE